MDLSRSTIKNWTSLQESMGPAKKRAMKVLINEYISLLDEPAEGFVVKVDNPFVWDVGIYGPPSTPYWGGYFRAQVSFPDEYPFEPPKIKFKSKFWHPNVYDNGTVCMSILHNPLSEDIPTDLPIEEKWNPTLSVRTVLLSLISLMGSPNPDSPANLEATRMYRLWKEDGNESYVKFISNIVKKSKAFADKDGVQIPSTLDEYIRLPKPRTKSSTSLVDYTIESEDYSDYSSQVSQSSSDGEIDEEPSLALVDTTQNAIENPNERIDWPQESNSESVSQNDVSTELSQGESSTVSVSDLTNESEQSTSFTQSNRSPLSRNTSPLSSTRKRRPPPLRLFPKSDWKKPRKQ